MENKGKVAAFFDSLGFSVAATMISMFVIGECTASLWTNFPQDGVRLLIWLVIAFHFVQRLLICWKARQQ